MESPKKSNDNSESGEEELRRGIKRAKFSDADPPSEGKVVESESDTCTPSYGLSSIAVSTLDNARRLLASLEEKDSKIQIPIDVERHFSGFNLKCIRFLYRAEGERVIRLLESRPMSALPVLIELLENKEAKLPTLSQMCLNGPE